MGSDPHSIPGPGSDPHSELLTSDLAQRFATMALTNIAREYPTKLDHFINGPQDLVTPARLHPVFWGSFDWHSCVHSHWMLARLLRMFPDARFAAAIRAHFAARFTDVNVAAEVDYLHHENRSSFVRTYGWAWLLKLASELIAGSRAEREPAPDQALFSTWHRTLEPLANQFVSMYRDYLPKARVPLRYGLHPNSAFGVAFALDYARLTSDAALLVLCRETALDWFASDADYPARFEPSGNEFLSPALVEADLMTRVLDRPSFAIWLRRFLPSLESAEPRAILDPVETTDRHDPQMVHLDGLNLSRAWCLERIAATLEASDARKSIVLDAALRHLRAGLPHVQSGDYMGEHWLATFAVYALTSNGVISPQ